MQRLRSVIRAVREGLNVYLQAAHGSKSIAHGFPNRRMRMDHIHHVIDGAFEIEHGRGFGKNLSSQRADDVNAEDLAIFFIGNNFDEAAMVAKNGGFAIADERKFSNFDG